MLSGRSGPVGCLSSIGVVERLIMTPTRVKRRGSSYTPAYEKEKRRERTAR